MAKSNKDEKEKKPIKKSIRNGDTVKFIGTEEDLQTLMVGPTMGLILSI